MDHKPLSDRTDLQSYKYDPENYQTEKAIGARKENGVKPIKKLKPWHVKAVKLHIMGYSNNQVAQALGKTASTISIILSDPKCQKMLSRAQEGFRQELDMLEGQAVDALRTGLKSGDVDTKLKAADTYFKHQERRRKMGEGDEESAEDVVAQIFQRIEAQTANIQINVNKGPEK